MTYRSDIVPTTPYSARIPTSAAPDSNRKLHRTNSFLVGKPIQGAKVGHVTPVSQKAFQAFWGHDPLSHRAHTASSSNKINTPSVKKTGVKTQIAFASTKKIVRAEETESSAKAAAFLPTLSLKRTPKKGESTSSTSFASPSVKSTKKTSLFTPTMRRVTEEGSTIIAHKANPKILLTPLSNRRIIGYSPLTGRSILRTPLTGNNQSRILATPTRDSSTQATPARESSTQTTPERQTFPATTPAAVTLIEPSSSIKAHPPLDNTRLGKMAMLARAALVLSPPSIRSFASLLQVTPPAQTSRTTPASPENIPVPLIVVKLNRFLLELGTFALNHLRSHSDLKTLKVDALTIELHKRIYQSLEKFKSPKSEYTKESVEELVRSLYDPIRDVISQTHTSMPMIDSSGNCWNNTIVEQYKKLVLEASKDTESRIKETYEASLTDENGAILSPIDQVPLVVVPHELASKIISLFNIFREGFASEFLDNPEHVREITPLPINELENYFLIGREIKESSLKNAASDEDYERAIRVRSKVEIELEALVNGRNQLEIYPISTI